MRALIVGHNGQDGTLLRHSLEGQGYEVFGVSRSCTYPPAIPGCPLAWSARDPDNVLNFITALRPDEVYYLAAYHTSSEGSVTISAIEEFALSYEAHVQGLLHLLVSVAEKHSVCRIFYAASSLVFDGKNSEVQDEHTPFNPTGYYGMTKAQGIWICREFRKSRGVFVSVGFLYNHESKHRAPHFLSQKIVRAAGRIASGSPEKLCLGDIFARVDWGYAGDFVSAFQHILKLPVSDDFIVATGKAHSVKEFAELTFDRFGLKWSDHIEYAPSVLKRHLNVRIGDASKLRMASGWKPTLDFTGLIEHLVSAEKARIAYLAQ